MMLSKRFAFVGLPAALLAAVLLIATYHFAVLTNLKSSVEAVAASMAQIFANTLWSEYGSLVAESGSMDATAIRRDPRTHALDREVRKIAAGTRVLKVKVYSPNGITLYSSDPAQIGGDYWKERNFQVALNGGIASRLTRKPTFEALDGPRRDLVVLESYIPAWSRDGRSKIIAVLEIYSDVTDLEAAILRRPEALAAMAVVVSVLLAIFAVQLLVLRRAERRWLDEQAARTRIAAEYAIEYEASRAKSAFLAGMSHELRTPLNAILGFAEMIHAQIQGPISQPRYVEYADHIHRAGRHLLGVIGNVLDLSKIEAGKTEITLADVDPSDILGSSLDMLGPDAERKGVTIRRDIAPDLPQIHTDGGKLRQVVLNIVSNAIKYTDRGGAITVSASVDERFGPVRLVISDNGVGMSEKDLEVALTPFGRVSTHVAGQETGTGLGLPLAKRTVEVLGGTFDIASAPGKGTRVTITLPAVAA
ncbi:hypothetical protein GCM10017083_24680 [Thalassobaculum fulvum]|uniref:histidine kinase n=1 Tax=Thalassobaculum fulvum TaxID=1633335 RepID=A0A918XSN9_9PROT|nr:HAMP domain-containing sensor histidine kinase [Thalassobaculum fulvum]GHD50889.1 hypothetical protein GCM10017083_24680 [Thalassobaculum fulvum]